MSTVLILDLPPSLNKLLHVLGHPYVPTHVHVPWVRAVTPVTHAPTLTSVPVPNGPTTRKQEEV